MELYEKTIKTEIIYKGKIINLRKDRVELPDGRVSSREIVEHAGGVTIIAINDDNEIILVEQYRKPADKILLELPAGKLEKGEKTFDCAKRELLEETGYSSNNFKKICSFYTTPGFSDEILHLYIAKNISFSEQNPDSDEFINVVKIKVDEIHRYIVEGKIIDAKTILGLLFFLEREKYE